MFMRILRHITGLAAIVILLCACHPAQAQSRAYTTITAIDVTPLSNGVQISIQADGILQYQSANLYGLKMNLYFPDARNGTNKNFFNINRYPVSYIQVTTPQQAVDGIGLQVEIDNFVNTSGSATRTADGQGVLLTIQSDRTIQGARTNGSTTATTKAAADKMTEVTFDKGLLSIHAVRADIHILLGAIAERAGLPITVDDAVNRNVSLNLRDVEPITAVQSIAAAYGLAFSERNGIYMLGEGVPTDLATYNLSGTESFRMQNTQAATASGLLPNFLFSYVKVNSEQNAVVVTAPSQMLAKIGSDLHSIDVPSPEISIEAIAVELNDTRDLNLGLKLGSPDPDSFSSVDSPVGIITYNTIGTLPRTFEANLQALEQKGKARVRARPRMAVVNGREASIFIGAQRFILTQFNQYGQTQTRIQPVDVGVKLSVTPLTGGNGEITTHIAPEVSNITELDLQTGLPVLSTRRADTTVRVKDGETIAIGGLTLNQEQTTRGKVPILGEIPLIGNLFRSRKKNTVQTELVIFITPRILHTTNGEEKSRQPSNMPNTPSRPAAP
jgi:type IV pilus assembly protein PilQ